MNDTCTKQMLEEDLQRMERQLETPIIPGELRMWLENVCQMCSELCPVLRQQIAQAHPLQYKQIKRDGDNLLRRVEQMQKEDSDILAELAVMERAVSQICQMVEKAEPNEARYEEHVKSFTHDALQFIIRVRTQERAIETWVQEAEFRDNGDSGAG